MMGLPNRLQIKIPKKNKVEGPPVSPVNQMTIFVYQILR